MKVLHATTKRSDCCREFRIQKPGLFNSGFFLLQQRKTCLYIQLALPDAFIQLIQASLIEESGEALPTEKRPYKRSLRPEHQVLGRSFLDDASVVNEHDPGSQTKSFTDVMSDKNNGLPKFSVNLLELVLQLRSGLFVHSPERLINEHDGRICSQSTSTPTRCFCPPLSWRGWRINSSRFRPTNSSNRSARSLRCWISTPCSFNT